MTHSVTLTADLAYGEDPLQVLDLYRPDVAGPVPAVVYLHGGGWQVGDKTADAKERLEGLAALGVAVLSANYRLVPAARYPAQIQDAKAAVAWVRGTGEEHGLAVGRVGVWGASAGGYLASMLGLTNGDSELAGGLEAEASRVDAVVDWFGQSDLQSNAKRTWLETEILNPPFEQAFLDLEDPSLGGTLVASASPLRRVTSAPRPSSSSTATATGSRRSTRAPPCTTPWCVTGCSRRLSPSEERGTSPTTSTAETTSR